MTTAFGWNRVSVMREIKDEILNANNTLKIQIKNNKFVLKEWIDWRPHKLK